MNTLQQVQQRIKEASQKVKRDPRAILLIAVSKGQDIEKIKEAIQGGQKDFGENYAQELIEKARFLESEKVEWHFLGHLQKNKLNKVLKVISWLHSLDSYSLAEAIHQRATEPLKCLLEINLAKEEAKTGLTPKEALELIPKLIPLTKIDLKGLMTMSPGSYFKELVSLLKEINERRLYKNPLTELSMGMSNDFEAAIQEGATMVRIGTAIFGSRQI